MALPQHVIERDPTMAPTPQTARAACKAHLDALHKRIVQDPSVVCVGVNGSVPLDPMHQVIAAAVVTMGDRVVAEPWNTCS